MIYNKQQVTNSNLKSSLKTEFDFQKKINLHKLIYIL